MKLLVFICLATLAFGAAIVEDDCNKVAVADVKTKCEKTATAAGASTACCLATFASPPTTPKQADNNALAAVVDPNKGGDVNADGKFYSCYKSGGVFRFKTHGDATTANKNAESWIAASVFCTAGQSPASTGAKTFQSFTHTSSTEVTGKATTTKAGLSGTAACSCGTSAMPTDSCAGLASADVKTKCATTSDGATPAKKCCLATFATVPTTPQETTNSVDVPVLTPTKGGKVDTKYYACYKSTSGNIRFKTGATAITADGANMEAWVDASLFCGTTAVGKAQAGKTYKHTVSTSVTGSATAGSRKGISGTATTCVCGVAFISKFAFILLAILANLWK